MSKHLDAVGYWDGNELELEITRSALSTLAMDLGDGVLGIYTLSSKSADSYIGDISRIEFEQDDALIILIIENGCARFFGSKESFGLLAENLKNLDLLWSKEEMAHLHFDPFSDRLLMSPKSEAFIISPRRQA